MIKVDIHVQADQIDELVREFSDNYYERHDALAERLRADLDRMLDDAFVARWAAEHWAADDRVMVEVVEDWAKAGLERIPAEQVA